MGLENESEKDVRSKKKSFPDLARAAGLKDSTVEILLKEDFDSVESIRCLTEDIVQEMGLTKAQLCLLQHWMKSLQPKRRGPTQSWDLPPPTKEKGEQDLSILMGAIGGSAEEEGSKTGAGVCNKPLHMPLKELCISKSHRPHEFVDKDFKKSADMKTFAELIYGSTMIMENTIMQGDTTKALSMARHLSFCAQKSLQRYTTESIIAYDDAVRDKVDMAGGIWWEYSDSDLCNRHLRSSSVPDKRDRPRVNNKSFSPASKSKTTDPCFRFNSTSGCTSSSCRLAHVCLICGEDHAISTCPKKTNKKM